MPHQQSHDGLSPDGGPLPRFSLAVGCASPEHLEQARVLAEKLDLPLSGPDLSAWDALLMVTDMGLALRPCGRRAPGPVRVDFVTGKLAHRRRFGGGRGQPLARAVGLKGGRNPRLLDVTAGLGRDGFVLATLGCHVTLVERSPVIAALLQDGLNRARQAPETAQIAGRMLLHHADGLAYLKRLEADRRPDVVYLDPMYPHRGKSALVKKEMRIFRQLVGDDLDAPALLQAALSQARFRVVVKRPARAEPLGGEAPTMSISSPNTRYDVYVNRGFGD